MVEALFNLGNAEQQLGNIDAARRAYENAARIRPGYDAPVINLVVMLADTGDRAGALMAAKRSAPFLAPDSRVFQLISELEASG
jgi:Flp pilus assembly protein TadD